MSSAGAPALTARTVRLLLTAEADVRLEQRAKVFESVSPFLYYLYLFLR